MKVPKKTWLLLPIAGVALIIGGLIAFAVAELAPYTPAPTKNITSFKECADTGYPVQQSYPEVCAVPGGTSFVNN